MSTRLRKLDKPDAEFIDNREVLQVLTSFDNLRYLRVKFCLGLPHFFGRPEKIRAVQDGLCAEPPRFRSSFPELLSMLGVPVQDDCNR